MTHIHDVVVVGARPAGAATAMLLARAGLDVVVVDRAREGSDTVSTHALMRGAVIQLHRWGLLDHVRAAGTPPVQRTTFHLAAGTTVVTLPGESTVPPPEVGSPAQDFTLTTVDGRTVSLEELRGKAVWIVFGASWCAACQAEAPDIEAASEKEAEEIRRGMQMMEDRIQADMDPVRAASQMDVDEVITPGELRPWLEACVSMAYQSIGYRRIKNPRIWSLHDLSALAE